MPYTRPLLCLFIAGIVELGVKKTFMLDKDRSVQLILLLICRRSHLSLSTRTCYRTLLIAITYNLTVNIQLLASNCSKLRLK